MTSLRHDLQRFTNVKPDELAAYLRARGWKLTEAQRGRATIWVDAKGDAEIVVPLNRTFRDFGLRVAEAVHHLAEAEDREPEHVLTDLEGAGLDIVRVRVASSDLHAGSIQVDAGVALIEHSRDLVLAAACAAHEPRLAFHSRKPKPALDFMEQVRLGQTAKGSFIVTFETPVPPPALELQMRLFDVPSPVPYERRVTTMLIRAVDAARDAAALAQESGDLQPFEASVRAGVSANLCAALAGVLGATGADDVSVGVGWAPILPVTGPPLPTEVSIPRAAAPQLAQAANLFRQQYPDEAVELVGFPVQMAREEGALFGEATIVGPTPAGMRRVRLLEVPLKDYEAIMQAHRADSSVLVVGHLRKEGRAWTIRRPREVTAEVPEGPDGEQP